MLKEETTPANEILLGTYSWEKLTNFSQHHTLIWKDVLAYNYLSTFYTVKYKLVLFKE